ncbi:MAG TPA: hydantoinase B/oxoprolinase family protein [Gemmatimonadales bacterium]|jgi:N-methylhydantoinase B|nr:hydantoinase B/oxoprolinase family protein [Gemmatimonadales bacterium]
MLDAIGLEVMAHAFAGIAEEMGAVLVASSVSPNVRERRDSSAALFDAPGEMIAQAAHIPVHLGAMPDAVAAVMALGPNPGDTFIINDPFTGGTHLPDITMVHAIELGGAVAGFTVVRAHHSDVGGMRPGSMPPHSTDIFQEGIILPPVRWAAGGVVQEDLRRLLLANVRTPEMRSHDLAAQQAACERGALRYQELAARHGTEYLAGAVHDLLAYAERRTRASLAERVGPGVFRAEDWLESDGVEDRDIAIRVAVEVTADGRLRCDFTGTDAAVKGNVNCPLSVTRSAVLFLLRCLVDEDVPTNGGLQRVIEITAPEGTLINAGWPHAVAAGNVETSQRITDTLLAAMAGVGRIPAQGQGTMNNVVFGGAGWTYYETLGGGQGASPGAPGPSGVHVAMSNTRNTPVEVFELEHPLRIRAYALRRGSGGAGRWRGGEGVVREYEALAEIEASLLTERRRHAPRGAKGGGNGAPGKNLLNGKPLGARAAVTLQPGDVLRVETPGGGGYGRIGG